MAVTVTYNSTLGAFIITSGTTGVSSVISTASGTVAAALKLQTSDGAVESAGLAVRAPSEAMAAAVTATGENQSWAGFATLWEVSDANKELFATWNASQAGRYLYVCADDDQTAAFASWLATNNVAGTAVVYTSTYTVELPAFVLGTMTSIDFTATNGRTNFAFRRGTGIAPEVTTSTLADTLIAAGCNFYGDYATGADRFKWFYPGAVSGDMKWIDSYVNAIWLNNEFQLDIMELFANANQVPYNDDGYAMVKAAMQPTIDAALNSGVIRPNVSLSASQIAAVNAAAGTKIDTALSTRGWYLQVLDASASVRANRQSPPVSFWYMDGQSIQKLNITSTVVQ